MDRDRAERIVETYETLIKMAGAQSLEDEMARVRRAGAYVQKYLPLVMEMHSGREELIAATAALPDDYAPMVEAFMAAVPELVRVLFARLYKGTSKAFPTPLGGRRSVPTKQRTEVCQFILAAFGRSVPLGMAQKRAAAKFGLGLRTVQRIWRDRSRGSLALDPKEIIRVLRDEPLP